MDAEMGSVFLSGGGPEEADGGRASWSLETSFPCSDVLFANPEKPLQDWLVDPSCAGQPQDSDSESDVLRAIDPNMVFPSGTAGGDPTSESDSGISEDPPPVPAPPTVYQVVYDVSGLGKVAEAPPEEGVISIELDEWSSRMLFADSCVVNELPVMSSSQLEGRYSAPTPTDSQANPTTGDFMRFADLRLTEEEQRLLNQEGIALPNNLPLTKAEERILKKVRRKIRNKQSAQDSRRRRKEYIDGLEGRAAACSAQNKDLQRTVDHLEKHNRSLMAQLRRLQSLIKQTVSKGAQTSTCILIILFSLGLIILPSLSPFSRTSISQEEYQPTGVISRNILTDPASSVPTPDDAGSSVVQSDPLPPDVSESGPPDDDTKAKPEVTIQPELPASENAVQDDGQSGNTSAVVARRTDPPAMKPKDEAGSLDVGKPAHADEM
ncbi:cyclic AMP-responsive element-binding protein 3-like protein 4 isoform X1 [Gadus morhua]|uniref:cyclic AMP-responsive element-binding protein 3-like protein 4 isoform X1 n=1 Tax=Gadus morhua TaxID=8049 RepID=UPI0011B5BFBA|nr:cyclic AMP-responsive element-binding protein 3-like protein 4 isoform X1 [Gadus morhua]